MATVMIVDDMEVVRLAISALLKYEGHQTLCAANGAEAIKRVQEGDRPDLVLMDIAMPEMDGLTALDRLRHQPSTQYTPVVMMSSQSEGETVDQAMRLGATEYLLKSELSWDEVRRRLEPYLHAPSDC